MGHWYGMEFYLSNIVESEQGKSNRLIIESIVFLSCLSDEKKKICSYLKELLVAISCFAAKPKLVLKVDSLQSNQNKTSKDKNSPDDIASLRGRFYRVNLITFYHRFTPTYIPNV